MRNQNNQQLDEPITDPTAGFRADILSQCDASAGEAEMAEAERLPNGSAVLVVQRGPNAGSRFALNQPVTRAGRHPSSDIYLDDVTVSRRHAEFHRDKGQFHVVDIGSLNGTYLNRKPVASAALAHGDEFQIGNFRLVFLASTKPPIPQGE